MQRRSINLCRSGGGVPARHTHASVNFLNAGRPSPCPAMCSVVFEMLSVVCGGKSLFFFLRDVRYSKNGRATSF